ncbi:hypothetical protein BCR33DRAFT_702597 [Rhizoclosmatium globosum]|uniref:Galactose oxidase n=1 Tax=Rhizoclosmatium globosum TaxID=329046 RepID=A0A1Y2BFK8_9FUNG|nr:hypothetical protein BCR33DRAFT_702597 [Rhizoclosmatium globosum]|eukprot:ORY33599.1 hypothetical protein BCR33DRAFT_702597 [Rhizoclosmatium globosum]
MQLPLLAVAIATASTVSAAASAPGWRIMNGITGSFCVHNALLPGNRLMCIERPHTHPYPYLNPNTNGRTSVIIQIDPDAGTIDPKVNALSYNAFCAGHSQGANGEIWVVGGDRQFSTTSFDASIYDANGNPPTGDPAGNTFLNPGIDRIRKFTPGDGAAGTWDESVQMSSGRWYPTVVTMYDGDLFIASGSLKNLVFEDLTVTNNPTYEFYPQRFGKAEFTNEIIRWAFPHNLYPVAFQLPSGKIFMMVSNRTATIDPTIDPGNNEANVNELRNVPAIDHAPWIYPHTPTSFLMPMYEKTGYVAEVVICGGSKNTTFMASSDCFSIQPDNPLADWKALPNMPNARLMPEATLLPDGTVLFTNGMGWGQAGGDAGQTQYAARPVFATDLYDPVANKWSTVESAKIMRSYHNGAVLLSDGSVITTGNEMANYLEFWGNYDAIGPLASFVNDQNGKNASCFPSNITGVCTLPWEMRVEQYSPQYLFNGPRPVLASISSGTKFTYNSTVGISLDPKGAPVTRITLIRYTTTTHSTNTDQRFIEPVLLFVNSTYAVFRIPPNGKIAPPGNWHIFGLSKDGVPSVSQAVLFGSGPATSVPIPTTSGALEKSVALFMAVLVATLAL